VSSKHKVAPADDPSGSGVDRGAKNASESFLDGHLRLPEVGPQGQWIPARAQVGAQPVSQHLSQLGGTPLGV